MYANSYSYKITQINLARTINFHIKYFLSSLNLNFYSTHFI